jgi:hypothetical protein
MHTFGLRGLSWMSLSDERTRWLGALRCGRIGVVGGEVDSADGWPARSFFREDNGFDGKESFVEHIWSLLMKTCCIAIVLAECDSSGSLAMPEIVSLKCEGGR